MPSQIAKERCRGAGGKDYLPSFDLRGLPIKGGVSLKGLSESRDLRSHRAVAKEGSHGTGASDSHYTPVLVYIHHQAVILYRISIDTYRS